MSQHKLENPQISFARRAARGLVTAVVIVVMLACAAWIVPSFFGYSRYVITGGSMTGTYDKGSIVFEKPVPVADLEVGDVITYMPPSDSGVHNLVTHRILRMEPAQGGGVLFTTKGDANPKPDPWHFLLLDGTQPVVKQGVPHAGWIFIGLAERQIRMLVIGLPAALIALMALGQLVGAVRGRRHVGPAPSAVPELRPQLIPAQRAAAETLPARSSDLPQHELV